MKIEIDREEVVIILKALSLAQDLAENALSSRYVLLTGSVGEILEKRDTFRDTEAALRTRFNTELQIRRVLADS